MRHYTGEVQIYEDLFDRREYAGGAYDQVFHEVVLDDGRRNMIDTGHTKPYIQIDHRRMFSMVVSSRTYMQIGAMI